MASEASLEHSLLDVMASEASLELELVASQASLEHSLLDLITVSRPFKVRPQAALSDSPAQIRKT